MSESDESLSAKKDAALMALLSEPTVIRAAQAAGVGERTLHRWLEEPDFLARYRAMRRRSFEQAVALTQRYSSLAVLTLAKVMTDGSANASAKVNAAVAVLRFGREGIELEDLSARVEALEAQAAPQVSFEKPGIQNASTRELGMLIGRGAVDGLGAAAQPNEEPRP